MITTIYDNQSLLISDLMSLHEIPIFELDPTYSKGNFYKTNKIPQPLEKFDLYPQTDDTLKADAADLPHLDEQVESIMFDPPFLAGYTKEKPSGIIGKRFHGFRYMRDVWQWYTRCLNEFYRILEPNGKLVFKCQDTVSGGKQYFSHIYIINEAEKAGFYVKDIFILLAKNRIIGHNHANQKHARKFHSYFIVFEKKSNPINHYRTV